MFTAIITTAIIILSIVIYFILKKVKSNSNNNKIIPYVGGCLRTMLTIQQSTNKSQFHHLLCEWSNKYGSIYGFHVFTSYCCVVSDPKNIQIILNQTNLYPSRGQNGMSYFIPYSLLGYADNSNDWKTHRKILSGAFTDNNLKKYAEIIVKIGNELIIQLKNNNIILNINESMAHTAYLVLAHTVMGGNTWLNLFPNIGEKYDMECVLKVVNVISFLPNFLWNYIYLPEKKNALKYFNGQLEGGMKVIKYVRENKLQGDSILHFLINHESNLTDLEIAHELMSFVVAGHETTANTLSFALIALALDPEIQIKARKQIKEILNNEDINYHSISKLTYIWAILRETLRYFPTVPFTFRQVANDTILDNYVIKKDTRVFVNMFHVCHNEEYFSNPSEFIPERWLGIDSNIESLKNHDITRNFGGGLRICIGKRFSEEESIILLTMLLQNFEISINTIDNIKPKPNMKLKDLKTKTNITMTNIAPVSLKFISLK